MNTLHERNTFRYNFEPFDISDILNLNIFLHESYFINDLVPFDYNFA